MKLIIIPQILLFIVILTNMENLKNRFLNYENYTENQIFLPYELTFFENQISFRDSVMVSIENILNIQENIQIKKDMFDLFLNLGVINRLNKYNYFGIYSGFLNPKEYIEAQKQVIKLYYLNSLRISENFDSHLILSVNDISDDIGTAIFRHVFLLNTKKSKILSITEISSYSSYNGNVNHRFTRILPDGSFRVMDQILSIDFILTDKDGEDILEYDGELWMEFRFDNKGYLQKMQE